MCKTKFFLASVFAVFWVMAALCVLPYPVYAAEEAVSGELMFRNSGTNFCAVVEDDAGLLTESEQKELLYQMTPITEYGNVLFKTIAENPMYDSSSYAEYYYEQKFGNTNGVIFLIDMDQRELWINSHEAIYDVITSSYANIITDNVYRKASAGKYYECAVSAFEQIYHLLNGGRISQPMKYVSNIFLGIVLAMIINYYLVRGLASTAKPSRRKILDSIDITQHAGNFSARYTNTTKKYVPKSSGSSGGGGGGGGHSGGGGHRF